MSSRNIVATTQCGSCESITPISEIRHMDAGLFSNDKSGTFILGKWNEFNVSRFFAEDIALISLFFQI